MFLLKDFRPNSLLCFYQYINTKSPRKDLFHL
nr:MAG TPA: hypothetical protein [Caudoviricetes sp.]DAU68775.1 MAG TPA: hypothetical protein [Caudoviricetes sp.]